MERLFQQGRLILVLVFLLSMVGVLQWMFMPRQEDPQMSPRWGVIVSLFPGADAETIERLVIKPLEDELSEVDGIKFIRAQASTNVAIIDLEVEEDIVDFQAVWDDVDDALEEAADELPEGATRPKLDHDIYPVTTVLFAVTGSTDPLVLREAATEIKDALLDVDGVRRVFLSGDPGEQITIEYDTAELFRLGIDPAMLAAQIQARNSVIPGGTIRTANKLAVLSPTTELKHLDELPAIPIILPSGTQVPLGEISRIRYGPVDPTTELMRLDGNLAVGVGVEAADRINLVRFGDAVMARVDKLRDKLSPLTIETALFQPKYVESRLSELNQSLLSGVLIVAVVLVVSMGMRLGLLVTAIVPLVTFISIAVFATTGGMLQQVSLAALVIAMGMLVDNAIVVTENVQYRIDQGEAPRLAAAAAARELALPLGSATATTIAAFAPMLLQLGATGDFTRDLPVMVTIVLLVSYAVALLISPLLSSFFLKRRVVSGEKAAVIGTAATAVGQWVVRHSALVVLAILPLTAVALYGATKVRVEFFPSADRNQFVVDISVPEGTHIDVVDDHAKQLEAALLERPVQEVSSVLTLVGRSVPRFFYNVVARSNRPHTAQLVVVTRTLEDVAPLIAWIRSYAPEHMPGVQVIPRGLSQGPAADSPIEVRLSGDDPVALREATRTVQESLASLPGARDVRNNISIGQPTIVLDIDDGAASQRGLTRSAVALAMLSHSRGIEITQYRGGESPIPMFIRSSSGEEMAAESLETVAVALRGGSMIHASQVMKLRTEWRPAALHRRDRHPLVVISSEVEPGFTDTEIVGPLKEQLARKRLPEGVDVQIGGISERMNDGNWALLVQVPYGALLLIACLMFEFNSFRRLMIVGITIPLAIFGVIPGLLLNDLPFGFMALLGVLALVGIVVNNAIILIDVIESLRKSGAPTIDAVSNAVRLRLRPILLTATTTICGLIPLAFSSATLWPPLAWPMITGLLASTVLTLFVVPALYRLFFAREIAREETEALFKRIPEIRSRGEMVALQGRELEPFAAGTADPSVSIHIDPIPLMLAVQELESTVAAPSQQDMRGTATLSDAGAVADPEGPKPSIELEKIGQIDEVSMLFSIEPSNAIIPLSLPR